MSETTLHRIYCWLRDNGPAGGGPVIARAIGSPLATVQASLGRLTQEGRLRKTGTCSRNSRWRVVDKRWTPGERRGKSPGSQRALRVYGGSGGRRVPINPNSLANLRGIKMHGGRYVPQPGPGIALEQACGRMPKREDEMVGISTVDGAE